MSRLRFALESWEPEMGPAVEATEPPTSEAAVDPSVEIPASQWRPIRPQGKATRGLRFVDGVRRIEARGWIRGDGEQDEPALFAAVAAGVLLAEDRALLEQARIDRALVSPSGGPDVGTRVGTFSHVACGGEDPVVVVQRRLRRLETDLVTALAPDGLSTVADGPLTPQHPHETTLGYVKTHRVRYLPNALDKVVAALEPGQRTPLFRTTTSWSRYSCYLRLPGPRTHAWAGIVRLEASADIAIERARELVDEGASRLPGFASTALKEARAPQNLFPIAGLERALRRRLGDHGLARRALLRAAQPVDA